MTTTDWLLEEGNKLLSHYEDEHQYLARYPAMHDSDLRELANTAQHLARRFGGVAAKAHQAADRAIHPSLYVSRHREEIAAEVMAGEHEDVA